MYVAIGVIVVVIVFSSLIYRNRDKLYMIVMLEASSKKGDQGFKRSIGKLLEYNPSDKRKRQYFIKKLSWLEKMLKSYRNKDEISHDCLMEIKEKILARKQELSN